MKKDFVWTLVIGFTVGIVFGALLWVPVTTKIIGNQLEKEVEQMDIYPAGSFKLTFSINEDVMDLEAKEAMTVLIEQFVMALAEATASYRVDGEIGHIKLLGARIMGDKETETRLKMRMEGKFIPRLSDKD